MLSNRYNSVLEQEALNSTAEPEQIIACAIIERAIRDYNFLVKRNLDMFIQHSNRTGFSKKEIEKFFKSDWCDSLLNIIGCRVSGLEIFENISAICA